jgi:RHS repeat-associated protein
MTTIAWFEADVVASQQYYPFGMLMPADPASAATRQYAAGGYDHRYGFNGKEGDDEVKGDDNQQDYGMRISDPRIGRFLSVDPLVAKLPQWAPYVAMGDNPIKNIDPDGRYFIGVDGEKVTISIDCTDGRDQIVLGNNASPDLVELVNAVNAAGSDIIVNQIIKAGTNKTKIHVDIVPERQKKSKQLGYQRDGLHQPHDKNGKPLEWDDEKKDFKGTPEYVEGEEGVYKEATITIFTWGIQNSLDHPSKSEKTLGQKYGYVFSFIQELAAAFHHEALHDTDEPYIKDARMRREGKGGRNTDPIDAHNDDFDEQEDNALWEIDEFNYKKNKK